ncbi:MAG: hypothetical protein ACHQF2_07300 [Flavobacteriales bacterium]|jgi:hypothetical protein
MSLSNKQFLEKLIRTKIALTTDETPLKLGSYSAIALQSIRIFTDGRDSNGSPIGEYSKKDIWINPNPKSGDFIPRNNNGFSPPTGKTGKSVFESGEKAGQPHKTSYFKGWKGFRETQGLQSAVVDLNYTGELFLDFCNPQGNVPTTRRVTLFEYVTSLKRVLSMKKLSGAEDRFKTTIGNLTKEEKASFYKVVSFEIRKILSI